MDNQLQSQINNIKSIIDFKYKEIDAKKNELKILEDKVIELEAQLQASNTEPILSTESQGVN